MCTTCNRSSRVGGDEIMQQESTRYESLSEQLTLHVGDEMQLLERASQAPHPMEIVLAPVELHQRNIQRRLREAQKPKEAFAFDDAVGVSRTLLNANSRPTEAIDRIDRLSLIRGLLDESVISSPTLTLPVGISSRDPQHIEQIRTEVETITNFHAERITAWRTTADELSEPIDADTTELLEAALDIEGGLRTQTEKAISDIELIRRATRELMATNGVAWAESFDHIERLSIFGLSSISAPYADFVHSIVATTPVDVHIYFRRATGEYLSDRMPALLDVSGPGSVVFE